MRIEQGKHGNSNLSIITIFNPKSHGIKIPVRMRKSCRAGRLALAKEYDMIGAYRTSQFRVS